MSILNFLMLCEDRPTGSSRIERLEGANLPDGILFRSTIDQEPHPPTVHICYAPGCRLVETTQGHEIIGIENVLPAGHGLKLITADEHISPLPDLTDKILNKASHPLGDSDSGPVVEPTVKVPVKDGSE